LRNVAIGETVHVLFTSLRADANGFCYLDPDAVICAPTNVNSIKVTRAQDGWHVHIEQSRFDWELGAFSTKGWYPVESITGVGCDE